MVFIQEVTKSQLQTTRRLLALDEQINQADAELAIDEQMNPEESVPSTPKGEEPKSSTSGTSKGIKKKLTLFKAKKKKGPGPSKENKSLAQKIQVMIS